jgi:hypothetical protein
LFGSILLDPAATVNQANPGEADASTASDAGSGIRSLTKVCVPFRPMTAFAPPAKVGVNAISLFASAAVAVEEVAAYGRLVPTP